ncbi:hypothetical protein [Pedobacter sp. NJ-S-72]
MKTTTSLFFLAAIFSANSLVAQQKKAVSAPDQKMNTFINNLMSKMTVDEKIGQLKLTGCRFRCNRADFKSGGK